MYCIIVHISAQLIRLQLVISIGRVVLMSAVPFFSIECIISTGLSLLVE